MGRASKSKGPSRRSKGLAQVVGAPPGLEHLSASAEPPSRGEITVQVFDFSDDRVEEQSMDAADLAGWLGRPSAQWVTVRWINVLGLHPWVMERLRHSFGFHPLSAEDVLQVPQRPGASVESDHLFVKLRVLTRPDEDLTEEQVSIFAFHGIVLTVQEQPGDVWEPLRARLRSQGTRLREGDAGFLLYALIDAVVDHCFPLLERHGEELERLEDEALEDPDRELLSEIQLERRSLARIRRVLWPTRELIDSLLRAETPLLSERTRTHLKDVHNNAIQLLDLLATQREMAASLTDLYLSGVSNRMNEVMKVLTVMASLFIPLTFIAGVYGMNFVYMPEIEWRWGYPMFWLVCCAMLVGLLVYFRRRRWI